MNPGIFYLYEYNNMQKLRNVGFLKLTRYYHSCTLQLNARGIPVAYADTLKLCAFYLENDTVGATVLTEISCTNHMVSARLNFAECQFPDGHTLNTMDGFFLPLSNGHILAAAVPGILVDTQKLLSVFETPTSDETPSENAQETAEAEATEEAAEANGEDSLSENPDINSDHEKDDSEVTDTDPEPEEPAVSEALDEKPDAEVPAVSKTQDMESAAESTVLQMQDITPCCEEPAPQTQDTAPCCKEPAPQTLDTVSCVKEDTPQQTVKKIQRSDMSALPRCYWHLANNSFLLHGYHNYSHLLLVEDDGRYWLGVPGVYDSREARAARLFGFPQFTDSYNEQLQLSDDEKNSQGTFGYWCCYLK